MPARKMRIEVFDGDGNRYTITFQGRVTREKALRLIDLVELLGGIPHINSELSPDNSEMTKFDKLFFIVERRFPIVWFSSKNVQSVYEEELKEPISLSTVTTYLSRMADRGVLTRKRMSNRLRFRVATFLPKNAVGLAKSNK